MKDFIVHFLGESERNVPRFKSGGNVVHIGINQSEGTIEPSPSDQDVTRKIKAAGQIVGVPLLDHIIFNRKEYYSFLENGML